VNCTDATLKTAFIDYFTKINKNPYDSSKPSMLEGTGDPVLGQSFLGVAGKTYTLRTNVGNADGNKLVKEAAGMSRE
jgi:hypothetical protein